METIGKAIKNNSPCQTLGQTVQYSQRNEDHYLKILWVALLYAAPVKLTSRLRSGSEQGSLCGAEGCFSRTDHSRCAEEA